MHLARLIVLAAVGVAAHPSGHAHMHRAVHEEKGLEKKDRQMIYATIDNKVVSWSEGGSPFKQAHKPTPEPEPTTTSTSTPPPAPTPTSTTAASPATTTASSSSSSSSSPPPSSPSSSGQGQGIGTFEAFACSKKRATGGDITYTGNTGCDGVYGSNVKLIKSNLASKYDYTIKVVGSSSAMQCVVWNKIGHDGGVNGFFNGNQVLTFELPANGEQYIAFDANTQGGMTCCAGTVPLTGVGQFNGAWCEWDFADAKNGNHNGFDASALVAGVAGGPFNPLSFCTADKSVCSTLYAGGGGLNAYLPGMEAVDGVGGNLLPGPVALVATFG